MTKSTITAFFLLGFFTTLGWAQKTPSGQLSLERIFSSNDFSSERFGPARWIEDGKGYTTLEYSKRYPNSLELVRYETSNGERSVLVPAEDLIPSGQRAPLRISDYQWSPDRKKLLIFTNTARVWRLHTRGDYWVLDLEKNTFTQLGGTEAQASGLMFAKFAPQSDRVAYVRENNLYVEHLANGTITALTHDGNRKIINGTFDWAYEEEFHIRDGFQWSPDGAFIAYWQLDASGIRDFLMINNTDSIYSYTIPVQYPKVGQPNSACRIGVVSTQGGATQWMKVPGDPRNNYIPRMQWAANSQELLLQHLNRKQNTNEVMLAQAASGSVHTLFTEKDSAWLDVVDDIHWVHNGKAFTWVSEQDGWRHFYQVDRKEGSRKLLTPGAYDIISLEHLDEKKGWVYFIASPENPTQRYLYRAKLNGKGKPELISPANQAGTHTYQISPNGQWAIHTHSNANTPPVTDLVSLPDHKVVRSLVSNKALIETVKALDCQPVEFFRVEIEKGVELDGYMLKPQDFDPDKKYPVLFYVYGEPWNQTVLDKWGWSRYLWHQLLAQQGYLVMSLDNRGTPAPRGRTWRKSVYGQIGILASSDQANGLRKVIQKYKFVDKNRIGIWGWSGGGAMTLNAIFRYPELYQVGMSVAPVTNQLLYDNIYQERYMGLPWENQEGYRKGSPVTYAKNLQGKLLLVHGTGDDNVHYQNSEVLINELIKHNKLFSLMVYPNRSHGIYEGENTSRHLFETLTHYLHNHLPVGNQETSQ
ncbi:S9 family peptidase [Rapidithrix thailandica]|uniref:S9 family peptidase n=1 Tax=Rapidithrix thailandica TaxID=413964 RepID=A0AAW9SFA3_9BACT